MDKEASEDELGEDDADRDPDESGEEEQQEDGGARQHQRLVQKNCQIKVKMVKPGGLSMVKNGKNGKW